MEEERNGWIVCIFRKLFLMMCSGSQKYTIIGLIAHDRAGALCRSGRILRRRRPGIVVRRTLPLRGARLPRLPQGHTLGDTPPLALRARGLQARGRRRSCRGVVPTTYSIYSTGRLKMVWSEDCLEFRPDPERWLPADGTRFEPHDLYRFVAFNVGPTICLSNDLAYMQMKNIAESLLLRYHVNVASSRRCRSGSS
jgi:hypothetical protein